MARTLSANVSAGINGGSSPVWLLEVESETATFRWATAACNSTDVSGWTGNDFVGSRLLKRSLSKVTSKIDLSKGGNRAELSGFSFRLVNGDVYSDTLAGHFFIGRRVELRLIFIDKTSPSWGNALKTWRGFVSEAPSWNSRVIVFNCLPSWLSRHKILPPRVLTRAEFPDITEDNEGRRAPIVLGDFRLGLGENKSGIASNRSPGASEVIHRDYFPGLLERPFQKSGNQPDYNPRAIFADHYLKNFPVPLQEGSKFVWNAARKCWNQVSIKAATFGGTGDHFNGLTTLGCFPTTSDLTAIVTHFVPALDEANSVNVTDGENAVDTNDANYTELNSATDVVSYEIPALYGEGPNTSASLNFWITRTGFVDDKVQYRINGGAWVDLPTYGALGTVASVYTSAEGIFSGLRVEFKYTQVAGFDSASFKIYSVFFAIAEKVPAARSEIFETGSGLIYERWIDNASHTTANNAGDLIENPAAAIEALLSHYLDIHPAGTNGALVFSGTQYLRLRTSESLESIAGEFTLSAWVYITESPVSTPHVIIRKCNTAGGATASPFDFYVSSLAKLVLAVGDGTTEGAITGTTSLSPNTWYLASATWDGTTARLFLNGAADGSSVLGLTAGDVGAEGNIGGNADFANSGLTGRIDELQVWNYARSAATLAAEYNARTRHTQGEEGLILLCHFDEGAGTHFIDSSGLNNDPTHAGGSSPTAWAAGNIDTPEGVNIAAFDDLHSNRSLWKLATVLSVMTEEKLSIDIIREICNEFFMAYFQDGAGLERVARIDALGSPTAITGTHILKTGKGETTAEITRGKVSDVRNEFHFYYKRNASSKDYEGYFFCTNPNAGAFESKFCNFATDGVDYWTLCRSAWLETKQVLRWEFHANYIRDAATAELACKAWITWLTKLPLFFSFDNSLSLIGSELTDNAFITHALLPAEFDTVAINREQLRLVEQSIDPVRMRQSLVYRSVGSSALVPPTFSLPGAETPTLDFDARDIPDLTGALLSTWWDKKRRDFLTSSGAARPTFDKTAGPRGGPAVYFDTNYMSTSALKIDDILGSGLFTFFLVFSWSAPGTNDANPFLNDSLLADTAGATFAVTGKSTQTLHLAVNDGGVQETSETFNGSGAFTLATCYFDGANLGVSIDGGAFVTAAAGAMAAGPGFLLVGADNTLALAPKFHLARAVFFDALLSGDNIKLVQEALNTTYGLY